LRIVERTGPGKVELAWTWLPTWIGMNKHLIEEIEEAVKPALMGKALDDETLEEAHYMVLDFLKKKFPQIGGLWDYLDSIKMVTCETRSTQPTASS